MNQIPCLSTFSLEKKNNSVCMCGGDRMGDGVKRYVFMHTCNALLILVAGIQITIIHTITAVKTRTTASALFNTIGKHII